MDTIRIGTRSHDIARAVQILHSGGVIAFPTDTVYGVGAHAMQSTAVERLYVVKQRPRDKAIPLLLSGIDALVQIAAPVPASAYALAEQFWPGALTMVLWRTAAVPDAVTAGGETVAVRVPDHRVTQALLAALGAPLAATSANLSGQPAPDTAAGVLAQLKGRVQIILDGGQCPGGVASTVIDLTLLQPAILRAGGVAAKEIERVLNA